MLELLLGSSSILALETWKRVFECTDEKLQHNNADSINVEASSILALETWEKLKQCRVCSD